MKDKRALIVLVVTIGSIFAYYNHNKQVAQAVHEQAQEHEKAKSVAILPPGTREAWDAYVDHRLSSLLQRKGYTVRLVDYNGKLPSESTFLSVTSSYKIFCDTGLSSIEFPQYSYEIEDEGGRTAHEVITLLIYMWNYKDAPEESAYISPDPLAEQPPPLGVDVDSIAADELRAHLCQRITENVQAIFAQQPPAERTVQ